MPLDTRADGEVADPGDECEDRWLVELCLRQSAHIQGDTDVDIRPHTFSTEPIAYRGAAPDAVRPNL